MELTTKQKEILDSFNGEFELDVEFHIQREVWNLILNISRERDELKNELNRISKNN